MAKTQLKLIALLGLSNRTLEELDEEWQRVLVHGIDAWKILNSEEKTCCPQSNRLVACTCIIDFLLSDSCFLFLLFDLTGEGTSSHKSFNGSLITEDIDDVTEHLKHLIFSLR